MTATALNWVPDAGEQSLIRSAYGARPTVGVIIAIIKEARA
ncbi:MAG: hypothetical protein ABUL64_04195 [Singulisphaera sp.]